jgi:hypothetical protein
VLPPPKENDEKEDAAEDMQKVTVNPKDLEFHINLELLMLIEKQVSVKRCKVHITDKIGSIIEPAQKLHASTVLPIYQGRRISKDKTFYEEQIQNEAKIFFNGVRGTIIISDQKLKFWQRFSRI